jgi:hypothetical protein
MHRSREDPADTTVVAPAHQIWRGTILAEDLQDLAVVHMLPDGVPTDDEAVTC